MSVAVKAPPSPWAQGPARCGREHGRLVAGPVVPAYRPDVWERLARSNAEAASRSSGGGRRRSWPSASRTSPVGAIWLLQCRRRRGRSPAGPATWRPWLAAARTPGPSRVAARAAPASISTTTRTGKGRSPPDWTTSRAPSVRSTTPTTVRTTGRSRRWANGAVVVQHPLTGLDNTDPAGH